MAKGDLKKGLLLTLEGPEGCGKSTQSKLLAEYLAGLGYKCIQTREPGGTLLGEEIRQLLLDSGELRISSLSELLLFEAARAAIVRDVISPALDKKKIVICDRFSDATFAYQGYAGGLGQERIARIDSIVTGGLRPDATILLDIETPLGLSRATKTGKDRMERKPFDYHVRVRQGYLRLAKKYPKRIKVIKVDGSIDEVQARIRREVDRVIKRYSRPG